MKVSVAMPTYKRLPQLKRAVSDVLSQTFTDWELVVSDDEVGEDGETWMWLQNLAQKDARVRVIKNKGARHGQIYNVNSACRATHGEWIKPFFDDDRMLPDCLAEFVRIAESDLAKSRNVVMIGARAQQWRNGVHVSDEKSFVRHPIEVIAAEDTLRAMCLLDNWNGRTPTHVFMRGDVVREGALMVENSDFKHPLDVRWFSRILMHGAFAMTDKVLVGECQGEVQSGTSELWKEEGFVTEELRKIYSEVFDLAKRDKCWPAKRVVDSLRCGTRGVYHLRQKQFKLAVKYLALMLRSVSGLFLTAKWLLRQILPGRFTATRRYY